jgi:hypothetical protein
MVSPQLRLLHRSPRLSSYLCSSFQSIQGCSGDCHAAITASCILALVTTKITRMWCRHVCLDNPINHTTSMRHAQSLSTAIFVHPPIQWVWHARYSSKYMQCVSIQAVCCSQVDYQRTHCRADDCAVLWQFCLCEHVAFCVSTNDQHPVAGTQLCVCLSECCNASPRLLRVMACK